LEVICCEVKQSEWISASAQQVVTQNAQLHPQKYLTITALSPVRWNSAETNFLWEKRLKTD
jgi:hypothetical protein